MLSEEQLDSEALAGRRAWKYVLALAVVLSLAALPHSQYQDALKMAVWTVVFLGLVFVYTWPFIVDALSRLVVATIVLLHFPIMLGIYPRIPHHGYLLIGLAIAVEYVVCLVPIAWLDLRSEKFRRQKR